MQTKNELSKEIAEQEMQNHNSLFLSEDLEELLESEDSVLHVEKINSPHVYFQFKDSILKTRLISYEKNKSKTILKLKSSESLFAILDNLSIDKVFVEFNEDNFKEIDCESKHINYKIKLDGANSYLLTLKIKDK